MISTIFKILFILSLISVQAFAWTLTLGGKVFDGTDNLTCTAVTAFSGSQLSWKRGFFEDCCVRLHSDSLCSTQQVGFSCEDWSKVLGQDINAFQVTNC
ncbi:hypothetical protein RclHR1_00580027 [Rhizophagus clarus]|uniref:Uncharacterized protein n=1 Tax=Rhizophagus clarus TaxID=94130 RepID=A0A2Z6S7G4_9GLOM|nr:hypothetical protein RclHR1_00580027 [Rhizophagus clarus]GES92173.1 hypothetical protein GLOIN_2v1592279 [Rhizophagus clarus]